METNINLILNSQRIVKPNLDFPFPSAHELLEPVINIFGENNFESFATHPESLQVTENDETLTAYGRAGVIKKIEIDENLSYNVGYMYALDLSKPVLKVFSGVNVKICSNMCIFNAEHFEKWELLTVGKSGGVAKVEKFMKNIDENLQQSLKIINVLKGMQFSEEETYKLLGDFLISFQLVSNHAGVNCITNAAKLLKQKGQPYYFEKFTSGWNIYNAITDYFGKKCHILDHPEKVWFVYEKFVEHAQKYNSDFTLMETKLLI